MESITHTENHKLMLKQIILIITFSIILTRTLHADPHELFLKAYELYTHSQFEEAVPYLEKSIGEDPNFPEAYFLLSRVLFKMGSPKRAIHVFKQGQALKRKIREHIQHLDSTASLEVQTGLDSIPFRAVQRIRNARKSYYRGRISLKQGKWFEAIEYFEKAAELDSEQPRYLNALGFALLDIKDLYSAEEVLSKSLKRDAFQRDIYEKLIRVSDELKNYDRGKAWSVLGRRHFPSDAFFKDRYLYFDHLLRLTTNAHVQEEE